MTIVPFSDVIIVRPIKERKTAGGIALPDTDAKGLRRGEVVVGHKGWYEDGIFHDSRVQVGDVVLYPFPGTEIDYAGEKMALIHERDLFGRAARKDEDAKKVEVAGETEEKW